MSVVLYDFPTKCNITGTFTTVRLDGKSGTIKELKIFMAKCSNVGKFSLVFNVADDSKV